MKRNDGDFKTMVSRIQSGEFTRQQAAEAYEIPYNTLTIWLKRSRVSLPVKVNATEPKVLHGDALNWATKDPLKVKAMQEAVERILRGEISALAASQQDPRLSPSTLAQKVRKIRLANGQPVQVRRSRYAQTT